MFGATVGDGLGSLTPELCCICRASLPYNVLVLLRKDRGSSRKRQPQHASIVHILSFGGIFSARRERTKQTARAEPIPTLAPSRNSPTLYSRGVLKSRRAIGTTAGGHPHSAYLQKYRAYQIHVMPKGNPRRSDFASRRTS